MNNRIYDLLQALNKGIPEREFLIQIGFLAAITGEAFYVFGRSGSGRSVLVNRIAAAFSNAKVLKVNSRQENFPNKLETFDVLIFKDVDPTDENVRENLKRALREKGSSPLIITHDQRPETILHKADISDNITLTLAIPESLSPSALCEILQNQSAMTNMLIPEELTVTKEEVQFWNSEIKSVTLSKDTLEVIANIANIIDKNNIYISIRRWMRLANMIKAIAYFNGRTETHFTDTFFMATPIWGKATANAVITSEFPEVVKSMIIKNSNTNHEKEFDVHETYKKIRTLINSSNNLYDTKVFNNEPCLSYRITIAGEPAPLYVPLRYMETDEDFNPFNEIRQVETHVRCNFHGTSSCTISIDSAVKGIGLRSSMIRAKESGKFEDFATLPSTILRENDPDVAAQKKEKLQELKKEAQSQMEVLTKYLTNLRDIYTKNKTFRDDMFCNHAFFDKIQNDVRELFDSTNTDAKKLKEALDLLTQAKI